MSSSAGISFTEFSYQLLQAYDFYRLHADQGCTLQIGGSDQWGNIQSGIDMIRREALSMKALIEEDDTAHIVDTTSTPEQPAYGLTFPLLTTSSGAKFGKSAGNAIWLDPSMTSYFDFYQVCLPLLHAQESTYDCCSTFFALLMRTASSIFAFFRSGQFMR